MPLNEEGREALREEGLSGSPLDQPGVRDDSFFAEPVVPTAHARADGEDEATENFMNDLADEPARPLTGEEREAAKADHGRPERVYAPASERVPKEPAPGDDRLIRHD
jgi:hypothetical protein